VLSPSSPNRRGLFLILVSTAVLVGVVGIVALIYFSAPERSRILPISRLAVGMPTSLAIQGAASPRIYAGTAEGLFVSIDRGSTWQADRPAGSIHAVAAAGVDPSARYVASDSFWRSDGTGLAIVASDLPAPGFRALAIDPTTRSKVFAIGPNQALLASDNGGEHWVRLGEETPVDATSLTIGNGPLRFYVGTSDHGVFASGDGRAWSNASGFVNGALPTRVVAALAYDPASGDSYVGPTGDTARGALYAGTDIGLFKSIDGGVSWSAMPFHQAIAALAVDSTDLRLMIVADSQGNIYRSTNGGSTWN
jgi:photosystem II stability/assembly factor-like uncharacterized protein